MAESFINAIVAERAARRAEAVARRRAIRAIQRQQFAAARDIGIQRRHAAREDPLRATESQDLPPLTHPGTTTNGGIS